MEHLASPSGELSCNGVSVSDVAPSLTLSPRLGVPSTSPLVRAERYITTSGKITMIYSPGETGLHQLCGVLEWPHLSTCRAGRIGHTTICGAQTSANETLARSQEVKIKVLELMQFSS